MERGSALWLKYRKQKLAQQSRLNKRQLEKDQDDEITGLDRLIQATLRISLAKIPQDKYKAFCRRLSYEDPRIEAQFSL